MDNQQQPVLEARSVTKRYGQASPALSDLTLRVQRREIYCILGGNGAGKTTTISLFLGFIPATAGHVLVQGIDVAERPVEARRHVSYLPENVTFYGHLTARQNIEFFSRISGSAAGDAAAYYRLLSAVGLPEAVFDRPVRTFSKGMRQKVGLAVAMAKGADALLLDEPTTGLDPQSTTEFMELLQQLRAAGHSILLSTHDLFRAQEVADRVGIMKQGSLVAELTRDDFAGADLHQLYLSYIH